MLKYISPLLSLTTMQSRSAETCADPSLADVLIQAYVADGMAHIFDFRWAYIVTTAMGTD